MQAQLLDLFNNEPSFVNFINYKNEDVVHSLSSYSHQFTHVIGISNSGKTHLLKGWVNYARDNQRTASYFNCNHSINLDVWQNIVDQVEFIAIDNIDKADQDLQDRLFDLYNLIKLHGNKNYLLTSSTIPLANLTIRHDLKTRILSGLNLYLKNFTDEEIIEILNNFTRNEGINITRTELNYLVNHYTRNLGALIVVIRKIADIAVLEKRNITIPLIKKVI